MGQRGAHQQEVGLHVAQSGEPGTDRARAVELPGPGEDCQVGLAQETVSDSLQPILRRNGVRVASDNHVANGCIVTGGSGGGDPGRFFDEHPRPMPGCHVPAVIGRIVVHHDDLQRNDSLCV
nr:hypothetical protein [Pseudarthrobacter sp. NamE2]